MTQCGQLPRGAVINSHLIGYVRSEVSTGPGRCCLTPRSLPSPTSLLKAPAFPHWPGRRVLFPDTQRVQLPEGFWWPTGLRKDTRRVRRNHCIKFQSPGGSVWLGTTIRCSLRLLLLRSCCLWYKEWKGLPSTHAYPLRGHQHDRVATPAPRGCQGLARSSS